MSHNRVPDQVLSLAHDRARARGEQDWAEADRLRAEIETAGWRVVDRGTDFALSPMAAPTVEEGGIVRYGSSRDVPSRLDEPATHLASVVLVATEWPTDLDRARGSLAAATAGRAEGVAVVVVADGPSAEQDAALPVATDALDVVRTSARLGQAAALNAGIRRATGETIVILDTSVEPRGDFISPLVASLEDSTVALTGGWGLVSDDLRRFRDAPAGDVDAIAGYVMAFRRSDAATRGPLDEHFRFYRNLDIWWSLVLRDEGEDRPSRRAVAHDLPAVRHEHREWTSLSESERDRLSKRNFYRILDRFGARRDLLTSR